MWLRIACVKRLANSQNTSLCFRGWEPEENGFQNNGTDDDDDGGEDVHPEVTMITTTTMAMLLSRFMMMMALIMMTVQVRATIVVTGIATWRPKKRNNFTVTAPATTMMMTSPSRTQIHTGVFKQQDNLSLSA